MTFRQNWLKQIDEACHSSFKSPYDLQEHLDKIASALHEITRDTGESYPWLETMLTQSVMYNSLQAGKEHGQSKLLDSDTSVYLIKAVDSKIYKIGATTELDKRIKALQNFHHERLELIASGKGGKKLEKELHKQFAHLQVKGEWFKLSDKELDEIVSLLSRAS
ncbi:GIY-YIG nuclease family protein [Vibrio coralliilyticus]|uniref:GIY-YIG nuclease family protein n=1 Tax=Vibrio coralliilyticus TaxID=190893 RepID=UPI0015604C14|nr:GIY-YIG nuclease family protein [Vibrio coralliilyticus]NRF60890.1 GIY-YIG nuclease family protein [Vibrio coralliilyticus]